MKTNTKSKLILYIIIGSLALIGIIHSEFSVKYLDSSQNVKNEIISDLRGAYGDWDPQITKSVGDYPCSVFIGDANNDGYNDLAISNNLDADISIFLWNEVSGDWDSQITKSVGTYPLGVFIGDANNDGFNDIATANTNSGSVSILLWNNASEDWNSQITQAVGNGPWDIFIGDANNDGYNDIATANYRSDDVSILLWNNTSEDWDSQITQDVGIEPNYIFIGDANNDGYNDIATDSGAADILSILLWNSTSVDWNPKITKYLGFHPYDVFIGDANNDGYNDIVTADNYLSHYVSILLWNSASEDWDSQITQAVGNGPFSVFIGDANNDGYNDIATANDGSDDVSILLWNSTSEDWNSHITKSVGDFPVSIFIGDANNDGYNDIATANFRSDDISILLWNPPSISIVSPSSGAFFGNDAPNFEVSIDQLNINTTWYNLNNGINITLEGFTGKINQTIWEAQGEDLIIIRFYANDTWGFEIYSEVSVYKDLTPPTSFISFIPYKESNIVNESTTFTITADDGSGSGVSIRQYKINNSGWIPYTGPFDLSSYSPGYYLISYQAIDNIGIVEIENTLLVKLEKITSKKSEVISGYNLIFLMSIICVGLIILVKKFLYNK